MAIMTIEIRMHHKRQDKYVAEFLGLQYSNFDFFVFFLSRDGPATRAYQSRVLYLGICERALYFVSVISFVSRIGFSVCAGCAGTTKRHRMRHALKPIDKQATVFTVNWRWSFVTVGHSVRPRAFRGVLLSPSSGKVRETCKTN
jgi:hypothetical protein